MSINPEGVSDSIDTLDKKTREYVEEYKPILESNLKNLLAGAYDKYIGIGVAHATTGPKIEIGMKDEDTYQKCAALRFINKNQRQHIEGAGDFSFIRHIDIKDEAKDNDKYTSKEIHGFKKRTIRCASYPVDNSWILD